jgi:hypothetical protein
MGDVNQLTIGAGPIYRGVYGATEPADTAVNTTPVASTWAEQGYTMGGIVFGITQTYYEFDVDQVLDIVARRLTRREVTLSTTLAEPTIANIKIAINGGVSATGSGFASLEPDADTDLVPDESAFIFDGRAPGGANRTRRVIVRKAMMKDPVNMNFSKTEAQGIPVVFVGQGVGGGIKPFKVIDATA